MVASLGVWVLVALSYLQSRISDDGVIYYDFMRHVVGENVPGYAYQFGVVIWDLPFYAVSRAIGGVRGSEEVDHVSLGVISIAIASATAVVIVFYLAWRLLRALGLPGGPGAILLTVFGSPLFYYALFQPGLKHAFDTVLTSSLALLLLRASIRLPTTRLALAVGGVLAVSVTVRYANLVLLAGVVFVFLRRQALPQAYVATVTTVAGAALILGLPLVLGIPYGIPPPTETVLPATPRDAARPQPTTAPATISRSGRPSLSAGDAQPVTGRDGVGGGGVDDPTSFRFDPLVPAKMLFTIKRGLFVWTPLTLLGVIGYLLLLRRDRAHRTFLVGLGLSALSLLFVHSIWAAFWTGGFSFSQRFLTSLFPLFVIGVAELLARTRMLVAPLMLACVAWTAFLALHHYYGYDGVSERDGANRIVELYTGSEEDSSSFWRKRVSDPIGDRWSTYLDELGLRSR